MKSRNWVRFFLSTLLVGAVTAGIVGFAVKWGEYQHLFLSFEIGEIVSVLFWFIGIGLIFSIISQMGFFAYLTIHRFGLGIFRSASLWNAVQLLLVAFVIFDLIYFRFQLFADDNESIASYIFLGLFLLGVGLLTAYLKQKFTSREAFVPALFFMVVVTTVEWFPVLRINEQSWLYLMLFPLLACNAYQLLMLPRFTKQKQ
ncbi:KinB-signaling pathway activation protein [Bacillus lacus]|uniref:KinB-signaling pathway activation protein n=1 Tax=Metabacillus lacus TaxID=1983721 RepID=A0A7X2IZ69_9BACI|nr:KinB-signaling pathway activation protein [Metabacillus lacus]MRX72496.1 KinB-signaling pathway activation protein [Metabacillus lacus]